MTKIYCDTADIKLIKKCIKTYNVDGVTTNPSIMRATGIKCQKNLYRLRFLQISHMRYINKQKR